MKCSDIGFGTYDCAYNIMPPWRQDDGKVRYIAVDKCLLPEVVSLWEKGIRTTGCCCGHAKQPAFISVIESDIPRMKALGYEVRFNECRPGDEDMFAPKTPLDYPIRINKGFNWWDGQEIALCAECGEPVFPSESYITEPNGDGKADFWHTRCAIAALRQRHER